MLGVVGLLMGVLVTVFCFSFFIKKDVLVKRETVDEESVVISVVEKATQSVVTISMTTTDVISEQKTDKDIGTGFIIDSSGLVVTNKHVVGDVNGKYRAIIGKDLMADVISIYRDPVTDLAILKVNKAGLKSVVLGDSDKIKVGQSVIAIGTALGQFRSTVTKGVVSGLGRGISANNAFEGIEQLDNVIQTDAAINPGNSGGPLFNSEGEVIGVNVATTQGAQSIGFALPINLVKDSIANFESTGEFDRPYLGVAYKMVNGQGAYVQQISPDSPAQKAGILAGDIITEVDGKNLADEKNTVLSTYINRQKIGSSVTLKILRDKKEFVTTVLLEKKN